MDYQISHAHIPKLQYTFLSVVYTFLSVVYTFFSVVYTFLSVVYTFLERGAPSRTSLPSSQTPPPPRVGGRGQRTFYYSALYLYCTLLYTVLTVSARGPRRVYTRAGKLFRFAYLYRSAVLSAGL